LLLLVFVAFLKDLDNAVTPLNAFPTALSNRAIASAFN
jgi:hypothetical protein